MSSASPLLMTSFSWRGYNVNIIRQLKVRSRIILLVLLPSLVIGAFSINLLVTSLKERTILDDLKLLMALSEEAGDLLQYIQDERDLSNGFLAIENNITGPKGTTFGTVENSYKTRLIQQRQVVDEHLLAFNDFIFNNQQQINTMPSVVASLAQLQTNLTTVRNIRTKIDQYIIRDDNPTEPQNTWTLTVYDRATESFQLIFDEIMRLSAINSELALMSNAHSALINLSNVYSTERGVVLRSIYIGEVDYNLFAREKTNRREIFNAINRFRSYATPAQVEVFQTEFIDSAENQALLEKWRLFLRTAGKKFEVEPAVWYQESSANMNKLNQYREKLALSILQQANRLYDDAIVRVWQSVGILCALLFVLIPISLVIIISITNPLRKLVSEMGFVASNKDLSYKVDVSGKNELTDVARTFKSLLASFNQTLTGVSQVENDVKSMTATVMHAMAETNSKAQQQNTNTDNVSVAMNQMALSIQEVSQSAQNTSTTVQGLFSASEKSSDNALTSKNIMEKLTIELDQTEVLVNKVNKESEAISAVVNVINDIAEQTNLLALNAAIEAARAGETGRGFAVVADEVRSLANRTQESTKNIQEQITVLQQGTKEVANDMARLKQQGGVAVNIVLEGVEHVKSLHDELDHVAQMSTHIATAAEEQSQVANDINKQIHDIKMSADEMTQLAESTATISQTLDKKADILSQHVAEFKTH